MLTFCYLITLTYDIFNSLSFLALQLLDLAISPVSQHCTRAGLRGSVLDYIPTPGFG